MSETNGQTNGKGTLLSLDQARATKTRKGNDFITVQQAYDLIIQECAKVHEHYLTQLPHFTARMIQDALMTYGLIVPQPGVDIAPAAAPAVSENASGDTPPADSTTPSVTIERVHVQGCAATLPGGMDCNCVPSANDLRGGLPPVDPAA